MITAEEMYSKARRNRYIPDVMIEFAKLHVEAALKELVRQQNDRVSSAKDINEILLNTIKNTYPLTNIK